MRKLFNLILVFLFLGRTLSAQVAEVDRLIANEFKMTFPSIYFKHNSTDYAEMPYTVDSCFRYVASHFKENMNEMVIWRDSAETEELSKERAEVIKTGLRKYLPHGKIEIHSMGKEQKLSRNTINMTSDSARRQYLFTFNSVFEISKTRRPPEAPKKKKERRRLIWTGWKNGFHWNTPGKK